MIRFVWFFCFAMAAYPLAAMTCQFTTECFEDEACQDTSFALEIDFANHSVTTDFGDLEVIAISKLPAKLVMFARGDGANYMLTADGENARLTSQMTEGPLMVGYIGTCAKGSKP